MQTGIEYPTRNGVPVNYKDLDLEWSRLNPANPRNYNVHHDYWTRRAYKKIGGMVIFQTLRNLEVHQPHILLDTHQLIHDEYDPPRFPTPLQAITEIERAIDAGEQLMERKKGLYVCRSIGDEVLKQCILNYNQLKRQE